ncbi:hypothetical protein HDV00_006948, partial [Rhizophlyctis rosea]
GEKEGGGGGVVVDEAFKDTLKMLGIDEEDLEGLPVDERAAKEGREKKIIQRFGVTPTIISVILDAVGYARQEADLRKLWSEIRRAGYPLQENNYTSYMEGLVRCGAVDDAIEVVCGTMQDEGIIDVEAKPFINLIGMTSFVGGDGRGARGVVVGAEGGIIRGTGGVLKPWRELGVARRVWEFVRREHPEVVGRVEEVFPWLRELEEEGVGGEGGEVKGEGGKGAGKGKELWDVVKVRDDVGKGEKWL